MPVKDQEMSCYSYLLYLSADKKRQFLSCFYLCILALACMFTSFCAVNIFAGTPGVDNYDDYAFKYFIIRKFRIEKSRYVERAANQDLSHENFQSLFENLVGYGFLNQEKVNELNKLTSSPGIKKAKKKKKEKKSKSIQYNKLEDILRLLMTTGAYNSNLPGIMDTMLATPSIEKIARKIQSEYETREQQTEEIDGQVISRLTAPLEDSGIIKILEQEASHFFEQVSSNHDKTVNWPAMALALSAKASSTQLFDLLRHRTDAERRHYLREKILNETIKLNAFLRLVAIYYSQGPGGQTQATKLMTPVLNAHQSLAMESLIENINRQYQHPAFTVYFLKRGLADFFTDNRMQFKHTHLDHHEKFKEFLNIRAPGMKASFFDLIEAIRLQAKQPADMQPTYHQFIKLISEEQEEVSNDASAINNLTKALVNGQMPLHTEAETTLPFYRQPHLNEAIASVLGAHGTTEQQLGMLIITDGRIHPYPDGTPVSLTVSSDNEYEVTFNEDDLQKLASYSALQEDWRDIARSLFELEQPRRSPADIAEEIEAMVNMLKEVTRSIGDSSDNESYYCLYHALYSAQQQMTHSPNEFAEKLYKVINQYKYLEIVKRFYPEL